MAHMSRGTTPSDGVLPSSSRSRSRSNHQATASPMDHHRWVLDPGNGDSWGILPGMSNRQDRHASDHPLVGNVRLPMYADYLQFMATKPSAQSASKVFIYFNFNRNLQFYWCCFPSALSPTEV